MSKPQNPLNYYRTYSYYFVLGVCDSTQTAYDVAAQDFSATMFLHAQEKFAVKTSSNGGKWVLLLNGATDTQLVVASARINSILNPSGAYSGESFYHTMNLEGEIIMKEPFGIRLYEILGQIANKLSVPSSGLVYFIKPIFVGHRDPSAKGGTTDIIPDVKPYIFYTLQLTAKIDEGGATYNLQTFGAVNGASKLPQYQAVASGFNFQVDTPNITLSNTFRLLEQKFNDYFNEKKEKEKADREVARAGSSVGISSENRIEERVLEYRIHLDPEYQGDEFIAASNLDPAWNETSNGNYYITQGVSSGIEELIRRIMLSCKAVIDDRGGSIDEQGKIIGQVSDVTPAHIFKIYSSVNSDPNKIVINYYIYRYRVDFIKVGSQTYKEPAHYLEFDYIYTGKNVDIKGFEMNMQQGTLFYHTMTSSNNLHLEQPNTNNSGIESGYNGHSQDIKDEPKKIDATIGRRITNNDARNTTTPISSGTYFALLQRWSAIESLGVKLEIKGNPHLMDQSHFTEEDLMSFTQVETTDAAPESERASERGSLKGPLYIKVNVKFPLDYSNPRSGFTSFWYDGPYLVHTIENNFTEDGDFTQTLDLYAMKTDVYGSVTAKDDPASGGNIQTNVPIPSDSSQTQVDDLVKSASDMSGATSDLDQTIDKIKDALQLLDGVNLPARSARTIIGRLQLDGVLDQINSVKGSLEKQQGFIQGAFEKLEQAQGIRSNVQSVLNEKSTMRMIVAAETEFDILKRLNIDPNNIANIIAGKAPILSEKWVNAQEALETAQKQYQRLKSSYDKIKGLYSKVLDIKDSIS